MMMMNLADQRKNPANALTKFAEASVDFGADAAHLAVAAGLEPDPAELGHGGDEGLLEGGVVGGEEVDGGARPAVGEEHLVGGEQALVGAQVVEVGVVEDARRGRVQHRERCGAVVDGAHAPQRTQVVQVHRRVPRQPPLERVDPADELVAPKLTEGVYS
jgi:hypothetical protein